MRVTAAMMTEKYNFAVYLIRQNQGIENKDLHKAIKKRFGNGMGADKMREARLQVIKERESKKAVIGMDRAGRKSRLNEVPREPRTISGEAVNQELLLEQNLADISGIIMKRLPGLKMFHLEVGANGKPVVKYKVTSERSGTIVV